MAKLGIFSDIHGNLEALTATLARLDQENCDDLFCLGDIVGYCANPAECLKIIQDRNIKCVMGNHDEYMGSFLDDDIKHLREDVRKSITWTQQQLTFEDLDWFLRLPMERTEYGVTLIHGSFSPRRWSYCMDEVTFANNFQFQKVELAFCGHSHSPALAIELPNEKYPYVDDIRPNTILPTGHKIMVNVGSVGQPRDRDPRSCAVIYDTATRELNLLRIEYDVAAAQKHIFDSPLPEIFGKRLEFGK